MFETLADQNSGIQAAYYGFIDRYRQVPGDFAAGAAQSAIGVTVNTGGNGDGSLANSYAEVAAAWEQLAKAQFLAGGFTPAAAAPTTDAGYIAAAPLNAFNGSIILSRNDGYTGLNPSVRLNLHLGRNVPVSIVRELDVKVDDGLPNTGVLRLTEPVSGAIAAAGQTTEFDTQKATVFAACTATTGSSPGSITDGDGTTATDIYDLFSDDQDCPPVFVY